MRRINKNSINVSQCWLMFVACVGDCEKVAAALHLDPEAVRKLAEDEGWHQQIKSVCLLSKSGKPGDYERAVNRSLNYIQAHQTRNLIGRVLAQFEDMSPEEILEAVSSVAKDGSRHVSGRFFADLTAAMSKVSDISYAALGDSCGERKDKASDESEALNSTALHLAVMNALNNPKVKSDKVLLDIKQELEEVKKTIVDSEPSVDVTVKQITDNTEEKP